MAAADEGSMTLLRHQDTAEACIMFTVTSDDGCGGYKENCEGVRWSIINVTQPSIVSNSVPKTLKLHL